jgi:hypothetical protein
LAEDDAVADIAYEDPAEGLQALRERMDAERAAALPGVWQRAQTCVCSGCAALEAGRAPDGAAALPAGPSTAAMDLEESGLGRTPHHA